MRGAGIDPRQLAAPDGRIPSAAADALWMSALQASEEPALAFLAARALQGDEFPVLTHLGASSRTLGQACTKVARWFHLVDSRLGLQIEETPTAVVMTLRMLGVEGPAPRPPTEFTAAALVVCLRASTRLDWSPIRVELSFPRPLDPVDHASLFHSELRYGSSQTRILVSWRDWERAVPTADSSLLRLLEDYAGRIEQEPPDDDDLPTRVRREVAQHMGGGAPALMLVARRLGMSDRTLQRRLTDCGSSWRREVDAVRQHYALIYLSDRDLGIGEVAWLLGFSNGRAFARAFKRWTGSTPVGWRGARDLEAVALAQPSMRPPR